METKSREEGIWDDAIRDARVRDDIQMAAMDHPAVHFRGDMGTGDPWTRGFGMFRDDPLFESWQEAVREYRHQRDEDDARLITGDPHLRAA